MDTAQIDFSSGSFTPSYGPQGVSTVTGVAGSRPRASSIRSLTNRLDVVTNWESARKRTVSMKFAACVRARASSP